MPSLKPEAQILSFPTPAAWKRWLARHHATSPGIWLRFARKGTADIKTLTHAQALPVALAHGWIDGPLRKHDASSYLHKFTPRRPRSLWSKRNRAIAEQLIASGDMTPAGQREVDAAQSDGRWTAAYDSHRTMTFPDDFLAAVAKDKKAHAFFKTLDRANQYSIAWRLQTAGKPETRVKRVNRILAMLAEGKTFR